LITRIIHRHHVLFIGARAAFPFPRRYTDVCRVDVLSSLPRATHEPLARSADRQPFYIDNEHATLNTCCSAIRAGGIHRVYFRSGNFWSRVSYTHARARTHTHILYIRRNSQHDRLAVCLFIFKHTHTHTYGDVISGRGLSNVFGHFFFLSGILKYTKLRLVSRR